MRTLPLLLLGLLAQTCSAPAPNPLAATVEASTLRFDDAGIIAEATAMLAEDIVTVTDFSTDRSAGGLHDYYSEGRYWWPDPENPAGPYIRRDGRSNPDNFSGHKESLARLSELVTTLTAAYELTGDQRYARRAIDHVRAWFVTPATLMNPHMLYGQAIKGITTGRGIGIIDTLRLIDVALSIELLRQAGLLAGADLAATEQWFGEFGDWLTTHPYGDDEKNNNNNHSTWWGAQVAAFARVAKRPDLTAIAQEQFRNQLPIQVATDGSLPDELGRTKPFHYLNYTLRAWATYAELLSTGDENFWNYQFPTDLAPFSKEGAVAGAEKMDGGTQTKVAFQTITLAEAMAYSLPFLEDPTTWPYLSELEPDIHPHQNDYLLFAYWGLGDDRYLKIWKELKAEEDDNQANLVVWQQLKGDE